MISQRKHRRAIAKLSLLLLFVIVGWLVLPGDIGPHESVLASAIVGALSLVLSAFIGGETYTDHSERRTDSERKID